MSNIYFSLVFQIFLPIPIIGNPVIIIIHSHTRLIFKTQCIMSLKKLTIAIVTKINSNVMLSAQYSLIASVDSHIIKPNQPNIIAKASKL